MTQSTRRSSIAGLVAAAIAVLAPGIAHAEPPANDDFDGATAVAALPFRATQDTAEATRAPDDPTSCYASGRHTVWFRYTAPENAVVEAAAITTGYNPVLTAFTGTRGNLTQVPGVCAFGSGIAEAFHVTAGTTYHILVMSDWFVGGSLTLRLETVAPSPNDDLAAAERVTGVPATFTGDLARASLEPGETLASCDDTAVRSVWYAYTPPTTRSVSVTPVFDSWPTISVYRGSELTEVECAVQSLAVFRAIAGETYFIRLADDPESADRFDVRIETAPPLTPSISYRPDDPSVFDDVEFFPFAGDRLGLPLVGGEVRFGDGASAPITGEQPIRHRYAADGVYQLEMTCTTDDGRTGTTSRTIRVETHDVGITSFTVPARARAGQTRPITVSVGNPRYDETVEVELLKRSGDFFVHIGTLSQWVPAGPNHTVEFPFAYTFSAADAAAEAVTFKAVATPTTTPFMRDARPADNEMLAATVVRPS